MSISDPKPQALKNLLKAQRYHVPLYQRPYEWEIEQIEELWEDLSRNEPPYFLGIVIFRLRTKSKLSEEDLEVVDGQQRLASLMLLIRAAADTIEGDSSEKSREIVKDYINKRDALENEEKPTLVLSKRDRDKFQSLLLGTTAPKTGKKGRPPSSWSKLDNAHKFFKNKFEDIKKKEGMNGIVDFLKDRVMELSFLSVTLEDDSDVYLFFESLNDRGMDLSIADLVKNRVCATVAKRTSDDDHRVDDCASRIDEISQQLGDGKVKNYLLHYCWSHSNEKEPPPRKQLMNWYKQQIEHSEDLERSFIEDLENCSRFYSEFLDPSKCGDPKEREVLANLKALGATRCYPLLIQGKKQYKSKEFVKLCSAVELLTFRHSTILKHDAKKLESVYFKLAQKLRDGINIEKTLDELKSQEAMKVKMNEVFKQSLKQFQPENEQVAMYILWKIEEKMAGSRAAGLERKSLSVEHILPKELDWEKKDDYVEKLGNLTLLSKPQNSSASNKPFKEKRDKIYKKEARLKVTQELSNYDDFTWQTIDRRQSELCKLALEIWDPASFF